MANKASRNQRANMERTYHRPIQITAAQNILKVEAGCRFIRFTAGRNAHHLLLVYNKKFKHKQTWETHSFVHNNNLHKF